jgi:hypothetical protein
MGKSSDAERILGGRAVQKQPLEGMKRKWGMDGCLRIVSSGEF